MAAHIGIVACSAPGAALCYETMCMEGAAVFGRFTHPEVTLHNYPLGDYMDFIEAGDWEGVASLMARSAERVTRAGADFIICPDNTIHQAYDRAREMYPAPWLHIAEVVAGEAGGRGFKRLGILGTRFLMEGPVYPEKLDVAGIEYRIPDSDSRQHINSIIFDELVVARFTEESIGYFTCVIDSLKKDGCDAVVLGCTEVPLIVTDENSPLPILDSTRLLARAALEKAVG